MKPCGCLPVGTPLENEVENIMRRVINSIARGLPAGLEELTRLGHTLWCRRDDVLAYF